MATLSIKEKFKELKEQNNKKIFSCPSCHKNLRVPVKLGKTLIVTCPSCKGQIQLRFPTIREQIKMILARPKKINLKNLFIYLLVILGISYWVYWYKNLGQ